ncbi:MAG: arylsulfatase [Candidatus Hydrogenedentota bacterium]
MMNHLIRSLFRILWLLILVTLIVSCDNSSSGGPNADAPNIIIILADDLGYGDLSGYGATLVDTPNVDRLIREGRKFNNAHSPSSVCTPSRYGLLTGEYAWRTRLQAGVLHTSSTLLIEEGTDTVATYLSDRGYTTGCVGKWHLGFQTEYPVNWNIPLSPGPLEVGFDYYYGVPTSPNLPPFVYVENHEVVDRQPGEVIEIVDGVEVSGIEASRKANEIGRRTTEKAVQFIEENKDDPFFLYVATSSVHFPLSPDNEFVGTSPLGPYGDFVHEFDWTVGQILDSLDANGLTENTLIIVTSDNGAWSYFTCDTAHEANGVLKGAKGLIDEGGHRVPMVARWPGVIEANSESDSLVSLVDLFSTLASAIGGAIFPDQAVDSVDRWYAFVDETVRFPTPETESTVHHSWRGKFGIRVGDWKYIPEQLPKEFSEPEGDALGDDSRSTCVVDLDDTLSPEQLYNLSDDLAETTNRIDDFPEIATELNELLNQVIEGDP